MSIKDLEKLIGDQEKDYFDSDDLDDKSRDLDDLIPSKREKLKTGAAVHDKNLDILDFSEKELTKIIKSRKKNTSSADKIRAINMIVKLREFKSALHSQSITEPVMRLLDFFLSCEEKLMMSGEEAINILTDNKERFMESMGILKI